MSSAHGMARPLFVAPCLVLGLALVALVTPGSPAHGEAADYVGAKVCGTCHAGIYEAWRQTAHATADAALGASPARRCLACHTTGEAPAGRPLFAGVECEACHGPGAGYALDDVMRDPTLARYLGLRDLATPQSRALLCAECHRASTRLAPFDPEAEMKRLEHP